MPRPMHWSMSEFLNLLHARGQCWGLVELGHNAGLRVRGDGMVVFHHVLAGDVTVTGGRGAVFKLYAGESAFVLANGVHALRVRPGAALHSAPFLDADAYGDGLHSATLGITPGTPPQARVLCGRLKVRWPGGVAARDLPPALRIAADNALVRIDALVARGSGEGAAALFTRAAALLLADALREDPDCRRLFTDSRFRDPVAHATQLMEIHLHRAWTIDTLARKVGMTRSSFAARFLAETGTPPMTMLTGLRMARAAMMLHRTPLRISEIAERVGYQSQAAFCRRFAAHFATTPARMRAGETPDGNGERRLSRRSPLPV
ncbi:MAG: AraC family transcriptional regulator [Sphingomonadales bacterium]|nr:AraC family transcriptional regulator [Sphingomonadales bacterium]